MNEVFLAETPEAYYVDSSMLYSMACEERTRLSYVENLRPGKKPQALVFGSSWHAFVASFYETRDIKLSEIAFIEESMKSPDVLKVTSDEEKRTLERGHYLMEAYTQRWKENDLLWENITYVDKDTGEVKPYIEIGFAIYLMSFKGKPVFVCGKVDRIRRYRVDGNPYNWESKTTSQSPKVYVKSAAPNHQITCYDWGVSETLGIKVTGTILDITYVSDRKIGGKFPTGVDIENDFARHETRRSSRDIEEFLTDFKYLADRFLYLKTSNQSRWARQTSQCHQYGGCQFIPICKSNLNPSIIDAEYHREVWEPWEIKRLSQLIKKNDSGTVHYSFSEEKVSVR